MNVAWFSHHVLNGDLFGDCEVGTRQCAAWICPSEVSGLLAFCVGVFFGRVLTLWTFSTGFCLLEAHVVEVFFLARMHFEERLMQSS